MEQNRHKVLIIKVGYSETLDPEISNFTSLGDVLRTTVLLHLYKDAHVTWLVDEKAYPILKGNPYISNLLIYNLDAVLQLQSEYFDTVINLEKVPGLCALADSVNAWRRYGFRFDPKNGQAEAYDGTQTILEICRNIEKRQHRKACWQEGLFGMVGSKWSGEKYILNRKSRSEVKYDIGFNYEVGSKWPLKAWPMDNWKKLESIMGRKYTVSRQQGLHKMEEYFDWIDSCRLIVTNDSFGLHLAIALDKKIVALFGPTSHTDPYLYGLGSILYPKNFTCMEFPCRLQKCVRFKDTCLSLIKPEMVAREIDELMAKFLPKVEKETVKS